MNLKFILFIVFSTVLANSALSQVVISGKITSESNEPLQNVLITVIDKANYSISNTNGNYQLKLPKEFENQTIKIGFGILGYTNQIVEVTLDESVLVLDVSLASKNLALEEVKVTALSMRNGVSNSSIAIDEQAIQLTQANSLNDVFSLLPGNAIQNSDLQGAQTFSIRTSKSGPTDVNGNGAAQKRNAAFGTAIIVDGINQTNNANLSTPGGNRSVTFPGGTGNVTTPGNGLDLRTIAVENIESIEVVGGVASAKYSDYSDGAVIINQKAGVSPYKISIRNNPGLVNSSISKGLNLNKLGSVHITGAYLYDNSDPTEDLKSFSRLTTSAIWSVSPTEEWKNTLSLNFSSNLDESKTDPEINEFASGTYKNRSFRVANRGSLKIDKALSEVLSYNAGFSYGDNYVDEQRLVSSQDTRYTSTRTEEGTGQAVLIPFPYVASYTLRSKPISANFSINNEFPIKLGSVLHSFSQGVNYSYNANNGEGTNYDLAEPFFLTSLNSIDYSSTKPDQYQDRNLDQHIAGLYLEDKFSLPIGEKDLDFSLGLRGDQMDKRFTLSPRLSTKMNINDQLQLNAAYGKNAKSAPLTYIYPNINYYEFPLTETPYFNPVTTTQYFPLSTQTLDTTYKHIEPMVTSIYEVGARFSTNQLSISTSLYSKNTNNGFESKTEAFARQFSLEEVVGENPDGSVNTTAIKDTIYYGKFRSTRNTLASKTKGIEILVNTGEIESIRTSFDLNTAFIWGEYTSTNTNTRFPTGSNGFSEDNIANNIYLAEVPSERVSEDFNIQTALTSIVHIPKLALVGTIRSELFWLSRSDNSGVNLNAVGYYDKNLNFIPIPESEQGDDIYADFRTDGLENNLETTNTYANFHLKLSKEFSGIGKLSFYANNFLNYRPLVERSTNSMFRANQEPQFGGELVLTIN